MKTTLSPSAMATMVAHARDQYPLEACGLIAGLSGPGQREITLALPLKNMAQSRARFDIDPRAHLEAIKSIRAQGLVTLGNYHSHPETPARPSAEDLKLYRDPSALYLILSLESRTPILKAFRLAERDGEKSFAEEDFGLGQP